MRPRPRISTARALRSILVPSILMVLALAVVFSTTHYYSQLAESERKELVDAAWEALTHEDYGDVSALAARSLLAALPRGCDVPSQFDRFSRLIEAA